MYIEHITWHGTVPRGDGPDGWMDVVWLWDGWEQNRRAIDMI